MKSLLFLVFFTLNVLGIRCDRARVPDWRAEWTPAQVEKIEAALGFMDRMGRRQCVRDWPCRREQTRCPLPWAVEVREVQAAGHFHARALRQADGKGFDAAYVPKTDEILLDPAACDQYTAYQLGIVLLDEAVHRGVPDSDTEAEHRVYYGQELPRYQAAGR